MKKLSAFLLVCFILTVSLTAFAGDVPEALMNSDEAQIFVARLISYSEDQVELNPTEKIKGDIATGENLIYKDPSQVGKFSIREGRDYVFAYLDSINPTYIFEIDEIENGIVEIDIDDAGRMWERFEDNFNDGLYAKAEIERLERIRNNGNTPVQSEKVQNSESGVKSDSNPVGENIPEKSENQTQETVQGTNTVLFVFMIIIALLVIVVLCLVVFILIRKIKSLK